MKKRLIHWLGGYTQGEVNTIKEYHRNKGYKTAYIEMVYFLQRQGGMGIKERYRRLEQHVLDKAKNIRNNEGKDN